MQEPQEVKRPEDAVDDGEEDDEEVEVYSSDATDLQGLTGALSEKVTLGASRRCVSKEMLEQMPSLAINTRYHEVTVSEPFGCFHLMQLIEKSIQVGALFSGKLFVPKEIWQQDRVRLAGVALKVEVFQQLKQGLEKTSLALPLSTDEAKAAFGKELDALLTFARDERLQLARAFPFLSAGKHPVVEPATRGSRTGSMEENATLQPQVADAPSSGSGYGIGKLTNLAYGFGRMVKKQAVAVVERVGAAQAFAVSMAELDEYAAVLCMFFNSTRSIEQLLGLSADADGTQEQVNVHKEVSDDPQLDAITMKKLGELAVFLDEVVVELVMRDVHSLLEAYLRRLTQEFGEFPVEHAALKKHQSLSSIQA